MEWRTMYSHKNNVLNAHLTQHKPNEPLRRRRVSSLLPGRPVAALPLCSLCSPHKSIAEAARLGASSLTRDARPPPVGRQLGVNPINASPVGSVQVVLISLWGGGDGCGPWGLKNSSPITSFSSADLSQGLCLNVGVELCRPWNTSGAAPVMSFSSFGIWRLRSLKVHLPCECSEVK